MKKLLIAFGFFVTPILSDAQDSLRVTLCVNSGMNCIGFPTMDKTIEHQDSLGRVTEVNIFHREGCNGAITDSDFIHNSDMFYIYDNTSNIIGQTTINYSGQDTFTTVENYWFDASGYLTRHTSQHTYQSQTTETYLDSIVYNFNNDKIYELEQGYNNAWLQLDTLRFQTWVYDAVGRDSIYTYMPYSNFILQYSGYNYFYYDSASNLITTIGTISSNVDSFRTFDQYDSSRYKIEEVFQSWDTLHLWWDNNWRKTFTYDSVHLKTEENFQTWDTLTSMWNNGWRNLYQYDSLNRLTYMYHFNCPDSFCSDTINRTIYTYDSSGHAIGERSEEYDGFSTWLGVSGSATFYDALNDTTESGYWYYVEAGCDVSNTTFYNYNSAHQLIHTTNDHFGCLEDFIDCDYYNLNHDSLLVLLSSFPLTVCAFDTVHIPATVAGGVPPYTYQWSPLINILDSNSVSPRIVTDTTITYTLTVTDSVGHTHSSSATIIVSPSDIRPATVTSIGVPCVGSPFYLTFNSDSLSGTCSYQWYLNSSPYSIYNDTVPIYFSGDYSVLISSLDCELRSNTIPVNLFTPVAINILSLGNTSICNGESVTLLADTVTQLIWNTGDSAIAINVNAMGNYFAVSTDTNGCVDTSNVITVQVHPLPVVNLGSDTILCTNQPITLDAGNGFSFYQWQDNSNSQTFTTNSLIPDTIFVIVSVTDSYTCIGSDTVGVTFEICSVVEEEAINTAFIYPNPAHNNFTIKLNSKTNNAQADIFNVFGENVYSITFNSNQQSINSKFPSGIYFVRITDGEKQFVERLIVQ